MDSAPEYLTRLNQEQRAAVESLDCPLLVLAGAGTGKTRVLTTRIAHLINTKTAYPGQILSVTFTNKAAKEMKERVERLLSHSTLVGESERRSPYDAGSGEEENNNHLPPTEMPNAISTPLQGGSYTIAGMWLGTFHSIAARILRRHAEAVGLTSTFTILDDDDQRRLIKQLMSEMNIDNARYSAKVVISIIQGWKDKALTPDKVGPPPTGPAMDEVALRIYHIYQPRMKQLNAVDFGDLTLHNLTIFQNYPEILQEYATRFKYILVDEYQDTNTAQYLWLRLLAMAHKHICCVGDDDQSIYGWRGAEVGNILKFEQDFPECEVIRLERNYRSKGHILGAASLLIANNKTRLGKTLWTEDENGEEVRIKSVWDDSEEARFVGEEVEAFQRDQISLEDMAILVRAGYQTRAFEERFITLGVPYRVVGGLRFYERMEIRDAVAYLRVTNQPKDDLAFERIINTPKRGVGKSTVEKLHAYARANNCSLFEATCVGMGIASCSTLEGEQMNQEQSDTANRGEENTNANSIPHTEMSFDISTPPQGKSHFLKGKAATELKKLVEQFTRWQSLQSEMGVAELADLILDESGYRAMWENDKSPEAAGRVDNLKELIRALAEFPSITEFLEHVGLVSAAEESEEGSMISIMTLHAAKGLEFDVVFLTGWEEGLFPSQRSMDEKGTKGLEEERRLAYVGITRARKFCTISFAANRRIYNQWQSALPSRFIDELPEEHIEVLDSPLHARRASGPSMFQKEMEDIFANTYAQEARNTAFEDFPQDESINIAKGTRVFHQKFGHGVVLNIDGDHIEVAFKHAGKKKLIADYLEMAG